MGLDLKIKTYLECKHGEGTTTYSVGDNIVCKAGGKLYIGKITFVGCYQGDKDSEPQPAIYIDTSKTRTSYSGEVILVGDITYLYNDSAAYRQETVQDLIDIVLDYRESMKKEEQDKVGKIFMGLWNLMEQE